MNAIFLTMRNRVFGIHAPAMAHLASDDPEVLNFGRWVANSAARAAFRRAVGDNLTNPTGMLKAIRALGKPSPQSAANNARLNRLTRNQNT